MKNRMALAPVEALQIMPAVVHGLMAMAAELPSWDTDSLAELFRQAEELETAGYATRCLIADILVRRFSPEGEERLTKQALSAAGQALGLAPYTVREMATIWRKIFSRLGEMPDVLLPAGFYQVAARAESKGLDPIEAVHYATEKRRILGENYTVDAFRKDIARNLPNGSDRLSSCADCAHFQRADAGARLLLVDGDGGLLAEAPGEGLGYCRFYKLLARALGNLQVQALSCPNFKEGERDNDLSGAVREHNGVREVGEEIAGRAVDRG